MAGEKEAAVTEQEEADDVQIVRLFVPMRFRIVDQLLTAANDSE